MWSGSSMLDFHFVVDDFQVMKQKGVTEFMFLSDGEGEDPGRMAYEYGHINECMYLIFVYSSSGLPSNMLFVVTRPIQNHDYSKVFIGILEFVFDFDQENY
jgi:hypothetical protein